MLFGGSSIGLVGARDISNTPTIVQRLASVFNLNEAEVQEVFDEFREEREAEKQIQFEENLDSAVAEGKITEAQKQALLAKHNEIIAQKEELKDMDPEARYEAIKNLHMEMRQWSEDNDIDLIDLLAGMKKGSHHGFKMGYRFAK